LVALAFITVVSIGAAFTVVQPCAAGWPWASALPPLVLQRPERITRHAVDTIPIHRATKTAARQASVDDGLIPWGLN
jgi:hypothetical protein